jgi:hypothetical protein
VRRERKKRGKAAVQREQEKQLTDLHARVVQAIDMSAESLQIADKLRKQQEELYKGLVKAKALDLSKVGLLQQQAQELDDRLRQVQDILHGDVELDHEDTESFMSSGMLPVAAP